MEIKVTSKNRGAAKRLLSTWHPSTTVRTWTVAQLTMRIIQAVNEGLITHEGVHRALHPEEYRDDGRAPKGEGRDDNPDAHGFDGEGEGEGEGQGEGEGEGEGDDDAEAEGEPEGDDGMTEQERQSYEEGKRDGQNGSERDTDHAEDGYENLQEAYDKGYDDGKAEQDGEAEAEGDAEGEAEEQEGQEEKEEEQEEERPEPQDHPVLKDLIKYIKAGLNVALVGPAGSGKSYLTRQAAEALGKDYYVNGSAMSKYDLIGYNDANGNYHGTPAYDAFTKGGVHTFDEFDASAPDAAVAFNGMTDDQPFYTFPCGQHEKHEDYVAIACMNTWGNGADADYVGRYKQDAAAMNRFVRVYVEYNESVERAIADKDIVERAHAVRSACEALGIRHVVSTRTIKHMQKARAGGVSNRAIDRDILFAGLNADTIKQIKGQV